MKYNPDKHHRRSIRLNGYDYTLPGAYFITLCVYQRECLFGEIVNGKMQLNELGQIVTDAYLWLETQYPYVNLDAWVVMPNHLHGIVVLTDNPRRGGSRTAPTENPTKRKPLGRLIGAFKTVSTKQINLLRDRSGVPLWQRDYYDRIIRDEEAFHTIRQYIQDNPLRWEQDQLHPDNPSNW
ncbi:MAG: transposase [Oculatellaceae cyanobacterium bins.114]|nr:transposase [Oculatellaceae cyanobacterium bins.114]